MSIDRLTEPYGRDRQENWPWRVALNAARSLPVQRSYRPMMNSTIRTRREGRDHFVTVSLTLVGSYTVKPLNWTSAAVFPATASVKTSWLLHHTSTAKSAGVPSAWSVEK